MKRISSLMIGAAMAFGLTACDTGSPVAPEASAPAPPLAFNHPVPVPDGAELLGTVKVCEDQDGRRGLDRCDPNGRVYRDGTAFYLVRDLRGAAPGDEPDGVPESTMAVARAFEEIVEVEVVSSHRGRPHIIFTGRFPDGEVATYLGSTTENGRQWASPEPLQFLDSVEVCEDMDREYGLERCDPDGRIYRHGTSFYLLHDNRGRGGYPELSVAQASEFSQILTVFAVFSFEGRPNVIFLGRHQSGAVVTRLGTTDRRGRNWAPLVPVYNALPATGTGCASHNGLPGLERCDEEAVIDVTESPAGIQIAVSGDFESVNPEIPGPDGIDETISTVLPGHFSDFQLVAVGFLYGKPYVLFDVFDADLGDRRVMIITTDVDGLNWADPVDAGDLS